jgi:UDP-N-acetylglucosamine--N-acetylmuramyl-(pentapeptide) pyrophosphoryl-undecaprenol N-acetylglucosamine transferase
MLDVADNNQKTVKPPIGIACGGTGGHIFPGLATAAVLKESGYPVILWLAGKDIEKMALTEWAGRTYRVETAPLIQKNIFKMFGGFLKIIKAFFVCRKTMRKEKIEVLLAMGSYASIPPSLAAKWLGLKLVLHEANAVPGRAVKFLAKAASRVALSFEEAKAYLPASVQTEVTGMPVRGMVQGVREKDADDRAVGGLNLVIMGGSRGASSLNRVVPEAILLLSKESLSLNIIHISGLDEDESVRKSYARLPHRQLSVEVLPFTHNMGAIYAEANLAICRAGASTCAELLQYGIPSILVPYPYATNQHQLVNARVMEKKGAAICLPEDELSAEKLAELIKDFAKFPDKLEVMKKNAMACKTGNAAEKLADLIEKVLYEK